MSKTDTVINRAMQFVNEGQPYCYGGKNQPMNKSSKGTVEWLKSEYYDKPLNDDDPQTKACSNFNHILGDDKTDSGMNYKQYINAESSPYVLIDCSGLTKVSFQAAGIEVGDGSQGQLNTCQKLATEINPQTNPGAVKPGALLRKSGHVAVMGYNGKIIEAAGWREGCIATSTNLSRFTSAFNLTGDEGSGESAQTPAATEKPATVIGKGKIVNISSYLNVRPSAGTNNTPIGKLYNGNEVDITGESGKWYQINYKGRTAYISKDYVKFTASSSESTTNDNTTSAATASTTQTDTSSSPTVIGTATIVNISSYLNVRAGASKTSAKIGKLYNGNTVQVLADEGKWYQIVYQGGVGYISKDYAKMNGSSTPTTTPSTSTTTPATTTPSTSTPATSTQTGNSGATFSQHDESVPTVTGIPGDFNSLAGEAYDLEMTREGRRNQVFYDVLDSGDQKNHINLGTGSAINVREFTNYVGGIDVTIGGVPMHFESDHALDEAIWNAIGAEYSVIRDDYRNGNKTGWQTRLANIGDKDISDGTNTAKLHFEGTMGYLNVILSDQDVTEVRNANLAIDANFGDNVKNVFAQNATSGDNRILKGFIHSVHAASAMGKAIRYFGNTQANLDILAAAVSANAYSASLTAAVKDAINNCGMGQSAASYCINNALKYISGT